MISPANFIPVAEETGLIVPIGEWVLRQACMDAAQWSQAVGVAVNLSPVQFKNPNLVATVKEALRASGLPAHRLELEITESVLLQNSEATLAVLHERPARDWSLDDLARAASCSRSVLAERFARLVGEPPMQYLTRWRMQLAALALSSSSAKVSAVARDVGYESEAAFSRAFKRETGASPAAWRAARSAAEGP